MILYIIPLFKNIHELLRFLLLFCGWHHHTNFLRQWRLAIFSCTHYYVVFMFNCSCEYFSLVKMTDIRLTSLNILLVLVAMVTGEPSASDRPCVYRGTFNETKFTINLSKMIKFPLVINRSVLQ